MAQSTTRFRISPLGPFSLSASTRFVEGFTPAAHAEGADPDHLHLAFPVEGSWATVGVCVTQPDADLAVGVFGDAPEAAVRAQVARVLSLDVDGTGFPSVGLRDPVIGGLQRRFPGLRPVTFLSPYEAAAWAVLSHRIRMVQAAQLKRRLAAQLGETVDIHGHRVTAFPSPDRLRSLTELPGLPDVKRARLHAIAQAAAAGELDPEPLRTLPRSDALARLQALPGIGPFSAELILLRGAGDPDAFPAHERRLHQAIARLYDLVSPSLDDLHRIADPWRPYRTWASVLIRTWWEQTP